MPTDTNINSLVINKLTKAQYDAIQSPSETELYLVEESVDTTPTSGSNNLVSSGGVHTAVQGKADKPNSFTTGHLASLNSTGDLADSGFKIQTISESDYDALVQGQTVDANTLYLITES